MSYFAVTLACKLVPIFNGTCAKPTLVNESISY